MTRSFSSLPFRFSPPDVLCFSLFALHVGSSLFLSANIYVCQLGGFFRLHKLLSPTFQSRNQVPFSQRWGQSFRQSIEVLLFRLFFFSNPLLFPLYVQGKFLSPPLLVHRRPSLALDESRHPPSFLIAIVVAKNPPL